MCPFLLHVYIAGPLTSHTDLFPTPRVVAFPCFQPFEGLPTKRPTKASIHGRAHESVRSSGQGSPVLSSPVLFLDLSLFFGSPGLLSSCEFPGVLLVRFCLFSKDSQLQGPKRALRQANGIANFEVSAKRRTLPFFGVPY